MVRYHFFLCPLDCNASLFGIGYFFLGIFNYIPSYNNSGLAFSQK